MSFDIPQLRAAIARHGAVIRVVVAQTQGSAPREAGASMLIWANGQAGTIGGGELEWQAALQARNMLANGQRQDVRHVPLGPSLGQCCGGSVTLLSSFFEANDVDAIEKKGVFVRQLDQKRQIPLAHRAALARLRDQGRAVQIGLVDGWLIEPLMPAPTPVWIYGAGHVGRALVGVITKLPNFVITWVDTASERFPTQIPQNTHILPAARPQETPRLAPPNSHHLVLTYNHALDLELCHAILQHGFASAGLIGSKTKWVRFRKRLLALGHEGAKIDRIQCPIGDRSLGKHPQAIALGVATALLSSTIKATKTLKNTNGEISDDNQRKRA